MDIWSWVHKKVDELENMGERRLCEIMDDISSFTCNDHHDRVDQIFPEGLALARKIGDKWVELFLRHWHLQSQVLRRENVKGMLSEAVDLLDFSHQEETKACPQRICCVQDLASCYGTIDGPGFVEERVQVTQETLEKINGSWPCYECVGAEMTTALLDAGRYEEAIEKIQEIENEIKKYSDRDDGSELSLTKTRALLRLSKLDEAEAFIDRAYNAGGGESFIRHKTLLQALIAAHKGDYKKALDTCLPFSEVLLAQSYFRDWTEIHYMAAKAKVIPIDAELLDKFHFLATSQSEHGAIRGSFNIFSKLAELAIESNSYFTAELSLKEIDLLLPQLQQDFGAQEQANILLERFNALVNGNQELEIDCDLATFIEKDFDEREKAAIIFRKAHRQWPESVQVLINLVKIYEGFRQYSLARQVLEEGIPNNPSEEYLHYYYGNLLLNYFPIDDFEEKFENFEIESFSDEGQFNMFWLFARASHAKDMSKSIFYLQQCLSLFPESQSALVRIANLYRENSQYEESIESWNTLIAKDPENEDYHWDRLIPATINEDWPLVRESAKAIGIDLEGEEGAVCQEMEYVRIQFSGKYGEPNIYFAMRTGPVSARITGIKRIEEGEQRYGHEVVFHPAPLNKLDQENEEGYICDAEGNYHYLYEVVKTLKAPEYFTFAIDGVRPSEEEIKALEQDLSKHNAVLSIRSTEEYRLYLEDEEGGGEEGENEIELQGLYAYILAPLDSDFDQLHCLLTGFFMNTKHPMIWPALAEKVGDEEAVKAFCDIEEKYQL